MVADEILVAREEDDGDVFKEAREHGDGGFGVGGFELLAYGASAFGPAGFFVGVDVKGFGDFWSAEVGGYVF